MKAVVFTLGCKVNECESNSLIEGLIKKGYTVSDRLERADLYIVNTCAVTSEAEKKSRQMVSRIKKLNPLAKIIFTGCASQKNPDSFIKKDNNILVTGTFNKGQIIEMIQKSGCNIFEKSDTFEELLPAKSLRTRSFIKVQDGCNNYCSYCIIPYLRGNSRSRNPESVLKEINNCKSKEIVITGINLSAYDYKGQGLKELIDKLKDVDKRIRLGSLEVGVITRELMQSLKALKNFAPHFHLSLQSGADNVLKKMNRHYTTSEYLDKVRLIREYFIDAGITTDIIVGFPSESEQDFNDTMSFVERAGFSDIHPFIFSPRSGTVAYKMKDIDPCIKKARLDELIIKKQRLKSAFINAQQGKEVNVLIEEFKDGYSVGYSENYIRVYVKEKLASGELKKVKIVGEYLDGALAK